MGSRSESPGTSPTFSGDDATGVPISGAKDTEQFESMECIYCGLRLVFTVEDQGTNHLGRKFDAPEFDYCLHYCCSGSLFGATGVGMTELNYAAYHCDNIKELEAIIKVAEGICRIGMIRSLGKKGLFTVNYVLEAVGKLARGTAKEVGIPAGCCENFHEYEGRSKTSRTLYTPYWAMDCEDCETGHYHWDYNTIRDEYEY